MTLSILNHAHGVTNNGGTTWTVTIPSANAGNLLLCGTACDGLATAATDNIGGAWTLQGHAAGFADLRFDAKVAQGGETLVTCHQNISTGGVGIVLELHSSIGPLALAAIYTVNTSTNTAAIPGNIYNGAAVVMAAAADWEIGFLSIDSAVLAGASLSPWTTLEPTSQSVGTGTLVTGADASRTGFTGSTAAQWQVQLGGTNISSVVVAVTDGTVSPPIPASTWW